MPPTTNDLDDNLILFMAMALIVIALLVWFILYLSDKAQKKQALAEPYYDKKIISPSVCIFCKKELDNSPSHLGMYSHLHNTDTPGEWWQHWDFKTKTGCPENIDNISPYGNKQPRKT